MPATEMGRGTMLAHRVLEARSCAAKMTGLLACDTLEKGCGLLIPECHSVHSFGMRYDIDVVFLDAENRVVKIVHEMKPRRWIKKVKNAAKVLELPAGTCYEVALNENDQLGLVADAPHRVRTWVQQQLLHILANIGLALFYLKFVANSYFRWQETESVIPFGLLFVNSLLVYLFLTRRRSQLISRRALDWFAALGTVFLSLCLRHAQTTDLLLLNISVIFQVIGIVGMLLSLASLGRSFGIVAALRTVKLDGAYTIVRHPLYAAELIFYVGYLMANPTVANGCLVFGIFVGQYIRAVAEEKILSTELPYKEYLSRVRFRFIPGLF